MPENDYDGFREAPPAPLTIAGGFDEVLPRLNRTTLCDMLRRLPPEEREEALRSKILRVVNLPGMVLHAACGIPALREARARGLGLVGYAEAQDLLAAARAVCSKDLLREATFGLARRWPEFSARERLTAPQALVLTLLLAVALLAFANLSAPAVLIAASGISGLFFLAVVALRMLCLMPPVPRPEEASLPYLSAEQLPVYSVLVPLFRETAVLPQLLAALKALRYPEEKLDIKLILEEEDAQMRAAVHRQPLDDRFEVIIVPAGLPQTKPRALNYALQFCRGQLVTIYDAEDIPDRHQLVKAARHFAAAPPELACLQAQLSFYNTTENWLTRQFTAEYAALFGVLLPVLANHNLPLPLGGTSNHFRVEVLRNVGAWDPYNVTEDADLGLRLARLGYSTSVLDSITFEEANTELVNWMRQRARWLKGFLLTWFVHMRQPFTFMREVGPAGFWAAQALTIGVFASTLLHPICMAATLTLYVLYPPLAPGAGLALVLLTGVNLLVLVAGYATAILLTQRGLRGLGLAGFAGTLATLPLYWILMSAAAWLALWQFITRPFHWNKTVHGISAYNRSNRLKPRPAAGTA